MHRHSCKVTRTWLPGERWQRRCTVADLSELGRSQVCRPLEARELLQVPHRQLQLRHTALQRLQHSLVCCEVLQGCSLVFATNGQLDPAQGGTPVPTPDAR